MTVKFDGATHTYFSPGVKYTSVTTLIGKFKQKFDSKFWSKYKALEQIVPDFTKQFRNFDSRESAVEYYGKVVDQNLLDEKIKEILASWRKTNIASTTKGTNYHSYKEEVSKNRGYEINPYTGQKMKTYHYNRKSDYNESLIFDLYKLSDGFYPELLVWNDYYKVAGQADKVFISTIGDQRFVDIDDYKTNKKIEIESYFDRAGGYRMMKPPVAHLMDCNLQHYELQISCYAFLLEQFGFQVNNLAFHHFEEEYPLLYRKEEVISMLQSLVQ